MGKGQAAVAELPQFDRLNYFYGQMLGAQQLRTEQNYFIEKLRLHHRCLHGWGAACGLEVAVDLAMVDPCAPAATAGAGSETAKQKKLFLRVEPGIAFDPPGNELVVRHHLRVELWKALSAEDSARLQSGAATSVWVSLCYAEIPLDPARPVMPDACGLAQATVPGKLRDGCCVQVTVDAPRDPDPCGSCCAPADLTCVPLARIDFEVGADHSLQVKTIDNGVRRMIGRPYATIAGIGWAHGGHYDSATAKDLLQKTGLQFNLSRPVRASTIADGVVDVWSIGSGTRGPGANAIVNLPGRLILTASSDGSADTFTYSCSPPVLEPKDGDRVLITVRTAFILDACCRPVDGAHVGGRVPALAGSPAQLPPINPFTECVTSPDRFAGWTSGTGAPGASFESWFFIGGIT